MSEIRDMVAESVERRVKPGDVLMVASDLGGYDRERGFDPGYTKCVKSAYSDETPGAIDDGDTIDSDPGSQTDNAIGLEDHLVHVRDAAQALCEALEIAEPFRAAVVRAAAWHDVGKAHAQFQLRAIRKDGDPERPLAKATLWRKRWGNDEAQPAARPFFRHELASALAFLAQHDSEEGADLVAFLIAAHHGKVRMGLRSLPGEKAPDDAGRLFARGVWEGDEVPKVCVGDEVSAPLTLSLALMRMGDDENGRPSWSARMIRLLSEYGPFKLAFLETIVRLADWKASSDEQKGGAS